MDGGGVEGEGGGGIASSDGKKQEAEPSDGVAEPDAAEDLAAALVGAMEPKPPKPTIDWDKVRVVERTI